MNHPFTATRYRLQSLRTGNMFDDNGWLLDAPGETEPTLIRAIYEHSKLQIYPHHPGIYKFSCWLPVKRLLDGSSAPVTYHSQGLGKYLGLRKLFITFSGYWPEMGCLMSTGSFKETEAYSVCARLDGLAGKVLVVASAGNTARAFARVCSDNNIPLLLCVPLDQIDQLWFDRPLNPVVKLISTSAGSDYYDAINLSMIVARMEHFLPEGGAKNVARRDGMGTTVLSAVTAIGQIPDLYFQAVGSGTGAIAAWEANLRLIADGRFGHHKMKLILSQNLPFIPMVMAWQNHSRNLPALNDEEARHQVHQIYAKVLSNRRPPYAVTGGLFDALSDTDGEMMAVSNSEAIEAAEIFKRYEGIDIHPAAAVATASLIRYVKEKQPSPDTIIMLNVTGGGEERLRHHQPLHYLKPDLVFDINTPEEEIHSKVQALFD